MSFEVVVVNPKEQYVPGDTILGRILCYIEEERFIEVRVKLVGEEYTTYNEKSASSVSPLLGWKAKFLESKNVLIRSGDLKVGNYEFSFKLTLPRYLPSSYTGRYGYVKFFIRASMHSYGRDRCESDVELHVFSPIDLNDVLNLWLVPSNYSDDLVINRWFCVHEMIEMEVCIEKNAFVLGELVKVDVVVSNNSSINVSELRCRLVVRVQAKVATPRQEFLNVHDVLAAGRQFGISPRRSKSRSFQLNVPNDAEIPNFEKCSLFTKMAFLEIVAETEDPSKPNLKVEIDLVLGHLPVDRDGSLGNIPKDKKRPDPVLIFPMEYGMERRLFKDSSISVPSNQTKDATTSNTSVPQKTFPRSPLSAVSPSANSNHMPVLPQVPSHRISLHSSFEVPTPVGLYEKRSAPYLTTNESPAARQNKPPSETPRISKNQNNNSTEDSPKVPPYPTHSPYPVGQSCPYPMGNSIPPYPSEGQENNPPYPKESNCPYPTQNVNNSTPYPANSNPPYPKADSTDSGLFRKISSGSRNDSFDREQPPYPVESGVPLSTTMPVPSRSSNSSLEREPLPYPVEDGNQSSTNMPMPPRSRNASFEQPPYPVEDRAGSSMNMPVAPGSRPTSAERDFGYLSDPKNLQTSTPPYPTTLPPLSKPNPPYPVPESSTASAVGNTAPYPPEQPSVHSTLGFSEFMPMPMPSKGSTLPCDTIGFAVSTSKSLADSQPVPLPPINVSRSSVHEPSAPPEVITPPIATIDETEDVDSEEDVPILSPLSLHDNSTGAGAEVSRLPELPTPPAGEIEFRGAASSRSKDITPPPSYDEIFSLLKKKEKPQREKQLAL